MSMILVLAETRRGVEPSRDITLEPGSARCSGSARIRAEARVLVAVVDAGPDRFADQVSLQGVDEVLLVATPNAEFEPHVTAGARASRR